MSDRSPRILLVLPKPLVKAIDTHQREAGILSRTETIRRLIETGLAAIRREATTAK